MQYRHIKYPLINKIILYIKYRASHWTLIYILDIVQFIFLSVYFLQEAISFAFSAFHHLLHDLSTNNTIASYDLACAIADGALLQIGFLQVHDIARYCVGSISLLRTYACGSLHLT
jgi:hypothetical protein